MQWLIDLLQTLNSLSPLAIIALLAVIIFMLVRPRKQVHDIKHNDLHILEDIQATLQRIEVTLSWIKAKLNGHAN